MFSIGCAVLMAQCGSFIAADSADISVVDSIMVRIGQLKKLFQYYLTS